MILTQQISEKYDRQSTVQPRRCMVWDKLNDCNPSAYEHIESSPVWDTSCLTELIYDLINMQFLWGKCLKPVTIQYSQPTLSLHHLD